MRLAALALALLCLAPLAPPAEAARLSRSRAQRVLNEGQQHFIAGRFDKALRAFAQLEDFAGELPVYRWNVARCLEELGRAEEAIAAFERYLQTKDNEENHEAARARVALLEERYLGRIQVTCNLSGAVVKVDQLKDHTRRCPTEWTRVRAGQYHLEAETAQGLILSQRVEVRPGRDQKVHLTFPGVLKISARGAPAEVLIDREVVGETPLEKQLPPATYIVTLRRDGLEWSKEIKLPGGSTVEVDTALMKGEWVAPSPGLAPRRAPRTLAPWITLSLSAVAAGLGGYYYTEAASGFDEMSAAVGRYQGADSAEAALSARAAVEDHRLIANEDRLLAYSGLGLSAALLGLSIYFFMDNAAPATPPAPAEGLASEGL
ncbi:PEGA domain-containing protein [Myxococcota bacterium]|nr:PEGA domain-containing protein [Myxococcota bacterium]MBU1431744.1 PEGA domain-containing protein [Myxococcota bacterium]MBU1897674.1 PEGA domain-containing protein [Myxococcota bacterium]